ncbi:MAG: glycosyltransferase family 2 protein [Proteobacteria bacterium]|nr:glycosyltransferase family 2 protein [Alphaproteobacteria bacterium]NCC03338.1 glycosyltransferase family 2 protein [Pseudomonadota bacterium]
MTDSIKAVPTINEPELSIVMPCLNEARTVVACVAKALGFLREAGIKGEVVVADNGSTDDSASLAAQAGARIVAVEEKGYGAALAGGIVAARGRYVIMGDCDESYDFAAVGPMLDKLRQGTALVVGNRFQGGIQKGAMPVLNRYLGNPFLSFIGKLFFGIKVGDFHCGLRGFDRRAVLDLDLKTVGMEYASEMIVRAALCGLSIDEVPVTLSPDGRDRKPHLHPWRDGWRHLRFLLLYSPRWLYMYPGLALVFLGLAILALLLPGPLMIGQGVGLDVHTLLVGAMSILLGVQAITFGVMARSYAARTSMIPRASRYDRLISDLRLEHLLALAGLLLACGFGALGWAMHRWSSVNFGALDSLDVMRVLIVALTCIVGGVQIGFSGFLLGVMQIRQK